MLKSDPSLLEMCHLDQGLVEVAFVLHDIFAGPFDEIAPIVERSEAAARQLASRACRFEPGEEKVPPFVR